MHMGLMIPRPENFIKKRSDLPAGSKAYGDIYKNLTKIKERTFLLKSVPFLYGYL